MFKPIIIQRLIVVTLFIGIFFPVSGQKIADSNHYNAIDRKKLNTVVIAGSTICLGFATGLYFVWYKDYPQSSFHFINDNGEWLQLDKIGHATTSYQMGLYSYDAFSWTGLNSTSSTIYAGVFGFLGLSIIEIMDGFSTGWGASSGDLVANFLGSSLFVTQQLFWKEQRISLKYSFHSTKYSNYRPDLLGQNYIQSTIKDYNGATYWLSANIQSFLPDESKFPRWINLAVGYGGDGMTGANSNPSEYNGVPLPKTERVRQFYLSPDIDLRRIGTKNKALRTTLKIISFIKIPMPTLEIDENGKVRFYPLYF
jgi:hypothetical protein